MSATNCAQFFFPFQMSNTVLRPCWMNLRIRDLETILTKENFAQTFFFSNVKVLCTVLNSWYDNTDPFAKQWNKKQSWRKYVFECNKSKFSVYRSSNLMKFSLLCSPKQSFGKAATKARSMASRKVLTETEHAELLGLFQQATIGDGNVWKIFSELMEKLLRTFSHNLSIVLSPNRREKFPRLRSNECGEKRELDRIARNVTNWRQGEIRWIGRRFDEKIFCRISAESLWQYGISIIRLYHLHVCTSTEERLTGLSQKCWPYFLLDT